MTFCAQRINDLLRRIGLEQCTRDFREQIESGVAPKLDFLCLFSPRYVETVDADDALVGEITERLLVGAPADSYVADARGGPALAEGTRHRRPICEPSVCGASPRKAGNRRIATGFA